MNEKNVVEKGVAKERDVKKIIEFVNSIQFGSVTIIVQDGRVMQIEKNEKVRMK